MSAAIAHNAIVAGEGAIADDIEHAKFIGKRPSLLLVAPHERRMQVELVFVLFQRCRQTHCQVERHIQTFDKVVATVWIAAEVRLSHTCDDVVDTMIVGIDGSNGEEEEITTRNEGGRIGVTFSFFLFYVQFGICQAA